jgi:hypothetical protein
LDKGSCRDDPPMRQGPFQFADAGSACADPGSRLNTPEGGRSRRGSPPLEAAAGERVANRRGAVSPRDGPKLADAGSRETAQMLDPHGRIPDRVEHPLKTAAFAANKEPGRPLLVSSYASPWRRCGIRMRGSRIASNTSEDGSLRSEQGTLQAAAGELVRQPLCQMRHRMRGSRIARESAEGGRARGEHESGRPQLANSNTVAARR